MSVSVAAVCLIACHGGPADHFATFAESLSRDVGAIEVYASGPALKKFQERGIEVKVPFSIDKISPELNKEAGLIKDLAAGAVLIISLAAAGVGLIIFLKYL